MILLDGKKIAQELQIELAEKIAKSQERPPGLAFILMGDHPASQSYVRAKQKACLAVGIQSKVIPLSSAGKQSEILGEIARLNRDPSIDGILVQLPLPPHIDTKEVMRSIDPQKDVDGFHPLNLGKLLLGDETGFTPCTPLGIQTLLKRYHIPVEGKHVVIIGRSMIVGRSLAASLTQKKAGCNATVTLAHSFSEHLEEIARSAEILVAAVGKPRFITKNMVRPKAVVIDVGINRLPNGKIVGDVDFENVSPIASSITPVPGGIGPMTIASLLQNTVLSYHRANPCVG